MANQLTGKGKYFSVQYVILSFKFSKFSSYVLQKTRLTLIGTTLVNKSSILVRMFPEIKNNVYGEQTAVVYCGFLLTCYYNAEFLGFLCVNWPTILSSPSTSMIKATKLYIQNERRYVRLTFIFQLDCKEHQKIT